MIEDKSLIECTFKLYIYGLVDFYGFIWRSEACGMLLCYSDNRFVNILPSLMRVYQWKYFLLEDIRSIITMHFVMLLILLVDWFGTGNLGQTRGSLG